MRKPDNVQTFHLEDDGVFPNNPRWPLLIYPEAAALGDADPAASVEDLFQKHGWGRLWRNGVYSFHHYHSNSHEVLGVFRGTARVQFGGPNGVTIDMHPGDVAVLPAGTAHCNLGSSADLGVVGGYPPGNGYDICRGTPGERARAISNIERVEKPNSDPVFGRHGGLHDYWPV